jgi:cytochrome c oxidase subunit 1
LAALFGVFAGFYYWFPKMSGYAVPSSPAQAHFWLTFIGTNLIFFPHHFLGLAGMPRRYVDYPDAFHFWHAVSSYGAYITVAGTLAFVLAVVLAFVQRERVGSSPWGEGATTLEWQLPSPPPFHTFNELPRIP